MKNIVLTFSLVLLALVPFISASCLGIELVQRTYDGSCNNLLIPNRGKTETFFKSGNEGLEEYPWVRVPKPDPVPTYGELDSQPDNDGPRGNARHISNVVMIRDVIADNEFGHSLLGTLYGQFINHDLENNGFEDKEDPDHLPMFSYFKDRVNDYACLANEVRPFPRPYRCNDTNPLLLTHVKFSRGVMQPDGTFKTINSATPYLDLDLVYGRSKEINAKLRAHTGGKLLGIDSRTLTFDFAGFSDPFTFTFEDVLPDGTMTEGVHVEPIYPDQIPEHDRYFVAGDPRLNENSALTIFHTLWFREHNKNCEDIMDSNPLFKLMPTIFDEVIFQKARALTIAKHQHIVYTQYFPSVYGSHFADKLGPYEGYKMSVDPSTSLTFATVAFRYGHFPLQSYSAIDGCGIVYNGGYPAANQDYKQIYIGSANPVPDDMNPYGRIASAGGKANLLRGMIHELSFINSVSIENSIRNLTNEAGAVDLGAMDIMRGRFNQVPRYIKLREVYYDGPTNKIYGQPGCPASLENDDSVDDPIECYEYISSDPLIAGKLKTAYRKLTLIDPIIGTQAEDHVEGTNFGRTSGNIIADQFKRSRDGDRFFYQTMINHGQFSESEKNTILSTTLGGLLTRNFDPTFEFPANPFVSPTNYKQQLINNCQA